MMKFKRMLAAAAVLMGLLLSACSMINQEEEGPPKVGLLLMSSPDENYSEGYYGYMALKDLERKYGVEISYNENVKNQDNAGYLLNSFGRKGYDLVIGIGEMFTQPMLDVSASYENTQFVCINGTKSAENMTSYDQPDEDVAYIAGAMAAALALENNVGYLIPEGAASYIEDFKKGAMVIKNTAVVEEVRIGSAISYEELVGYLNSRYITSAGLYYNSTELEGLLAENGIYCSVAGGLIGSGEKRQDWPRIGYDYSVILDIVYGAFQSDRLAGETVELGFKDRAAFIEGYLGLSEEMKIRISAMAADLN